MSEPTICRRCNNEFLPHADWDVGHDDPPPMCMVCSQETIPILMAALEKIECFPLDAGHVGPKNRFVQDLARAALKEAMEI